MCNRGFAPNRNGMFQRLILFSLHKCDFIFETKIEVHLVKGMLQMLVRSCNSLIGLCCGRKIVCYVVAYGWCGKVYHWITIDMEYAVHSLSTESDFVETSLFMSIKHYYSFSVFLARDSRREYYYDIMKGRQLVRIGL